MELYVIIAVEDHWTHGEEFFVGVCSTLEKAKAATEQYHRDREARIRNAFTDIRPVGFNPWKAIAEDQWTVVPFLNHTGIDEYRVERVTLDVVQYG